MARPIRHTDTDPGWIRRELRELRKQVRELSAAKRLGAATIGTGAIESRYPSGRKVLQIGTFRALNSSAVEVEGLGFRLMLDDDYAIYGLPDLQPAIFDLFRDNTTGRVDASFAAVTTFGVYADEDVRLYGSNRDALILVDTDGSISLLPKVGQPVKIGHATTAAAANCVIGTDGTIQRSTSSRRYKRNITNAAVDVAQALKLTPRKFRMKADKPGASPEYVGFIAEEAADLGLDAWVTSDDEGPEAFSYATWVVALQAIAQRHEAEKVEMQAQIADLTSRLEALEARES